jgi:hypothetical protein
MPGLEMSPVASKDLQKLIPLWFLLIGQGAKRDTPSINNNLKTA